MLDDADVLPPSKEVVRAPSVATSLVGAAAAFRVMLLIFFMSPARESDGE